MKLSRRERRLEKRKERLDKLRKEAHKEFQATEQHKPKVIEYKGVLKVFKNHYKALMLIPFALLLFSLIVVGTTYMKTGALVYKGVTLQGGITMTISSKDVVNLDELKSFLEEKFPSIDMDVRALSELGVQKGFLIDASNVKEDELVAALKEKVHMDTYSVETIGPSLGGAFFKQSLFAIIIAFALMSLVVFAHFRTFVPSAAVILAALSDILFAVACIDLMGIRLSTAGIAAFLMLIGYSVDTDILLTTRVVKGKEGAIFDRVVSSIKTGLLMNLTALGTVLVALIFSQSEVISQIMLVLFFGLIADIYNTWIQNAGILRYYMERKGVH